MSTPPGAAVTVRPAAVADRAALEAFIDRDTAGTAYADVPRYFLRLAFEARSSEARAAVAERNGEVIGFALYGDVAGSAGTARMHFISVAASARLRAVGRSLCAAAVADLVAGGARLVIAEVPDDPVLVSGRALLTRCGFAEEARVPDYYRDGVALLILAHSPGEPTREGV